MELCTPRSTGSVAPFSVSHGPELSGQTPILYSHVQIMIVSENQEQGWELYPICGPHIGSAPRNFQFEDMVTNMHLWLTNKQDFRAQTSLKPSGYSGARPVS